MGSQAGSQAEFTMQILGADLIEMRAKWSPAAKMTRSGCKLQSKSQKPPREAVCASFQAVNFVAGWRNILIAFYWPATATANCGVTSSSSTNCGSSSELWLELRPVAGWLAGWMAACNLITRIKITDLLLHAIRFHDYDCDLETAIRCSFSQHAYGWVSLAISIAFSNFHSLRIALSLRP